MKKLLICTILFLFFTATCYAYTIDIIYSGGGNAYYDIYNHRYINGQWVVGIDAYASDGYRVTGWTVTSDSGSSGQVWIDVLIESDLTWDIHGGQENLFFAGGYALHYHNPHDNQTSLSGTLDFKEKTGIFSLAYKQRILVDLGEEYYSSVSMSLDMPVISADPPPPDAPESVHFWTGIQLSLDSRITYLLPSEKPLPVPEPATFLLFGVGLVGFVGRLLLKKPMSNKE